jgi:ParB-like chromosome segregation protein Spo0J
VLSDLDNGFVDKQFPPSAIPQTPTHEPEILDPGSNKTSEETKPNPTVLTQPEIQLAIDGMFKQFVEQETETATEPQRQPNDSQALSRMTILTPGEILNRPIQRQVDTYDADEILYEDIATRGIQTPILVRRNNAGRYVVVDGQRRLTAIRCTSKTAVPVVILTDCDEADAAIQWIRADMQTIQLNPLERATAVWFGLQHRLKMNDLQLKTWAHRYSNIKRGAVKSSTTWRVYGPVEDIRSVVELTAEMESYLAPIMKFSTMMRNHLPLLSLPEELAVMVVENKISVSAAAEIATTQDLTVRQKLIEQAREQPMTVKAVKSHKREHKKKQTVITAAHPIIPVQTFSEIAPLLDTVLASEYGSAVWKSTTKLLSEALEIVALVQKQFPEKYLNVTNNYVVSDAD